MKPFYTVWALAGAVVLGCTGNDPQASIDKWNAEFVAHKDACARGNRQSCQVACQMSIDRKVCADVRQKSDMTDPATRYWVEQCEWDVARQGRPACIAAGMASPLGPANPTAQPVSPLQVPTPALQPQPAAPPLQQVPVENVDPHKARAEALAPPAAQPEVNAPEPPPTIGGGTLPRGTVRQVVTNHRTRIRNCYEGRLAANPNLAGKVTVEFTIAATGRVTEAKVTQSTMADPVLDACITNVFKRMVFPAPHGGGIVKVTYPFTFVPKEQPER
jgi:TonB family protein